MAWPYFAGAVTQKRGPSTMADRLCICGCGELLAPHAKHGCKLGHRPLCACGCGTRIDRRNRSGYAPTHKNPPGYVVNPATGCHEWTGRRHTHGYGLVGGENAYAHRLAYEA